MQKLLDISDIRNAAVEIDRVLDDTVSQDQYIHWCAWAKENCIEGESIRAFISRYICTGHYAASFVFDSIELCLPYKHIAIDSLEQIKHYMHAKEKEFHEIDFWNKYWSGRDK